MGIESRANPRLKDIRRLRRKQGARALLEGPDLVDEALAAGLALETTLATPEFLADPRWRALLERLPRPPLEVTASLFGELTDADSPSGLLAVTRLERGGVERLPVEAGTYLYLDGVQQPANLGAIARVAEAAAAVGVALGPGSVHPNHARALRASAGSLLRLAVAVDAGVEALDRRLEPLAPTWVALVPRGGAPLYSTPLDGTVVLALGAEGPGLRAEVEARCGLPLTVPMAQPVESLNVAVAAALVLYELRRRSS